ncbi:MAG: hypothetical protein V1659_05470 [Candidatus Woesearchaeota archaeon]
MSQSYNLKQYWEFNNNEKQGFILTAVVCAFILTFTKWGDKSFDAAAGLVNFFFAAVFFGLFLFFHIFTQKVAAIRTGHKSEYDVNIYYLIAAIIICFVSSGTAIVFIPGLFYISLLKYVRIGALKHETGMKDLAEIGMSGFLGSLMLVVLFYIIYYFLRTELFFSLAHMNFLIALYSLIPVPKSPGWHILYHSRWQFIFALAATIVFGLLLKSIGLYSVLVAAIIGFVVALIFYRQVEKR